MTIGRHLFALVYAPVLVGQIVAGYARDLWHEAHKVAEFRN